MTINFSILFCELFINSLTIHFQSTGPVGDDMKQGAGRLTCANGDTFEGTLGSGH